MPKLTERFRNGWNAFFNNKDPTSSSFQYGYSTTIRPDRPYISSGTEKTIVNSIYNRIAMDVAAVDIRHVKIDENGRFEEIVNDSLNEALSIEANIDQTGRNFIQDVVISMFDEGNVAIIPVDTSEDPNEPGSYEIETLRVGKIIQWYPEHVKVNAYNDRTGKKEDLILPKRQVAIVENPLYYVMNEPNSVLKRLVRKLNLLDFVDEQSGSGKLDLIIQLPYAIKTEARKQQAEDRRKEIEMQLTNSKYGIAYTDGTEHITQLNRSIENNLLQQVQYLTESLYAQLGITDTILNGTANEETMLNYNNRTVEPILSAITGEMKRKFLTKAARTRGHSIMFFTDPFRLTPVGKLAEIADRFTRNEILSSNEVRALIGFKPVKEERADMLINKNINHKNEIVPGAQVPVSDVNNEFNEGSEEELNE